MTEHHLKTWPPQFQAILDRTKTFEFRRADRPFAVGDLLYLEEYEPEKTRRVESPHHAAGWVTVVDALGFYTGRRTIVKVTHIMDKGFGLPDGFVIMSLDFLRPVPLSGEAPFETQIPPRAPIYIGETQIPTHTFP